MARPKQHGGYESFQYLEAGRDYTPYDVSREADRVPRFSVALDAAEEARVERLTEQCTMISLHEHLGVFPHPVEETPNYVRQGRMATAFRALAESHWDAIFDNLMDGVCRIESSSGWKWTEVLHDLGMRLCDIAHQDQVVPCHGVADILRARENGKIGWMASIEGAAMIENELDRIEILYGFGVRMLGVTYSEANALGSGLKEANDGGLTSFGRKAVERMNKVGILIDCSHAGDRTTLDTIKASRKPTILSHIGARALWSSNRLAPDDVLRACAEAGGVIGIEAAPHTTITKQNRRHGIESFMEHFEYIVDLVGIDHVGFGADTVYGDHVGLHRVYAAGLSLAESRSNAAAANGGTGTGDDEFPRVEYVEGLENPTEVSHNIVRWLVKNGYSDEDIAKVVGDNVLRLLRDVWVS
jgi:membrane dipeptidase